MAPDMSGPLYHWRDRLLEPGDHIEPGSFGRHVSTLRAANPSAYVVQMESILETTRIRDLPGKPSRYEGTFAWATPLEWARQTLWAGRNAGPRWLYEVEIVSREAAIHVGDGHHLDVRGRPKAVWKQEAFEYWASPPPSDCILREVLTNSPLRVVRLIEERIVGPEGASY